MRFALLAVFCLASLNAAPPDAIEPDRPGFSESGSIVAAGQVQFEGGISLVDEAPAGSRSRTFGAGSPLLRLGVGHGLELRLSSDGFLSQSTRLEQTWERINGLSDAGLGAKLALVEQKSWYPSVSVLAMVSLPVGHEAFTSGGYNPTVKLLWSKDLPAGFNLGGNLNYSSLTSESHRFSQNAVSLGLGHALLSGWQGFGEVYRIGPSDFGLAPAWMFDGGMTHLLGRNAQFDVSAGRTLKAPVPSWFVGLGFAVRFGSHG